MPLYVERFICAIFIVGCLIAIGVRGHKIEELKQQKIEYVKAMQDIVGQRDGYIEDLKKAWHVAGDLGHDCHPDGTCNYPYSAYIYYGCQLKSDKVKK